MNKPLKHTKRHLHEHTFSTTCITSHIPHIAYQIYPQSHIHPWQSSAVIFANAASIISSISDSPSIETSGSQPLK